ncbi:aminotransferase YbdL [Luminiphilus syltensis NOR5-1B]|uniref:Aminotransferase YbdL n=1 Tax=Luminiphilus syltensis NOR5-1B TaxID=565045 RepID=B8KWQ4_9GAMM|nr:methionine aminotransferase [Luminiphilus syltensis]EED35473.1 aminotransferase YbdL [Luminiphilus syltensis NOR5-1B]
MLTSKLPKVGTTIFTQMSALAAEHGAINLSQGFPDFPAPERLRQALGKAAMAGRNQYPPMSGLPELREAVARQIQRFRDVVVDPVNEITIVPGATEGIFCAITAVVKTGDEVILLDPAYDSYAPAVALSGGLPVHVPLGGTGFKPDWGRIEAAITARTRLIVINSPHNPSGSVFTQADMKQLDHLAGHYDLLVCSDEVYEFLVFDDQRHYSVLEFPALRERSFAHFSFGKTFGVTGWKTGYCVAPPALTQELRKIHQYVAFVGVTPVQAALAQFMDEYPDYPATLAGFYQQKRDLFCQGLAASRFRFTPSTGSYFQVLDYSDITDTPDTRLCEQWTREIGVASIPMSVFYQEPPKKQQLRFCFAKADDTLQEAARRLCKI